MTSHQDKKHEEVRGKVNEAMMCTGRGVERRGSVKGGIHTKMMDKEPDLNDVTNTS